MTRWCRAWWQVPPGLRGLVGRSRLVCDRRHGHRDDHHHRGYWWTRPGSPLQHTWTCRGLTDMDTGRRCGVTRRGTEDTIRVSGWRVWWNAGQPEPLCPRCCRPDMRTAAQILAAGW